MNRPTRTLLAALAAWYISGRCTPWPALWTESTYKNQKKGEKQGMKKTKRKEKNKA